MKKKKTLTTKNSSSKLFYIYKSILTHFPSKQQDWISFITNTYFKMECKILDITINSARDLQDVNLFFKMKVYAVVSIQDHNITKDNTCMQITPIDKDRGRNPEWNSPMQFFVNTFASQLSRLFLVVELKADKKFGNKDIGEVQVPIEKLLDSFDESNNEKSVSYSVITPSGEAQGLLYFTYKFSQKFTIESGEMPVSAALNWKWRYCVGNC